jgi:hypothetical protein
MEEASGSYISKYEVPVYCRIRGGFRQNESSLSYSLGENNQSIELHQSNSSSKHFNFFKNIFDVNATNQDIFDSLLMHIDNVLNGYNSTIFAYGQTGSGKTFSLTGGKTFAERGLIPRSVEYFWNSPKLFKISCSYVEIHNNAVRDLLSAESKGSRSKSGNRRTSSGFKTNSRNENISIHTAENESDLIALLFRGNVKRMNCETFMNHASSRSHCIFTMYVETYDENNIGKTKSSKFHLVDLAGSEDVHKSNHDWETLREGKSINLSLHYLEQVIVRLHERNENKNHSTSSSSISSSIELPIYRNSLLTSMLRDSLGGNCCTVFLVCINPEQQFVKESIATCRFGERCSRIKMKDISENIVIDLQEMYIIQQKQIKELNDNINVLNNKLIQINGIKLTSNDIIHLHEFMEIYLSKIGENDDDEDMLLAYITDLCRSRKLLQLIKNKFQTLSKMYMNEKRYGIKIMSQLHLKNIEIEELETKLLEEEAKNKKLQENVKVNHKVSVSVQTKKSYSKQIENSVTQMNTSSAISNNETIIIARKRRRVASPEALLDHESKANGPPPLSIVQMAASPPPLTLNETEMREMKETKDRKVIEKSRGMDSVGRKERIDIESSKETSDKEKRVNNDQEDDANEPKPNPNKFPSQAMMETSIGSTSLTSSPETATSSKNVLEILHKGRVFLKYGRRGKPKPRFVWLSKCNQCICWCPVGANTKQHRKLEVSHLRGINVGRDSIMFQPGCSKKNRMKTSLNWVSASFSMVFESRTLDLQFDMGHDHDDVTEIQKLRGQWVHAIEALLKL